MQPLQKEIKIYYNTSWGKKKSDSFQTNKKILLRKSFDGGPGTKYWQRSTKQNILKKKKKNTEYSSNISNENKMEQKIKFMQSI